jgi:hypothetical protein
MAAFLLIVRYFAFPDSLHPPWVADDLGEWSWGIDVKIALIPIRANFCIISWDGKSETER